MKKLWTVLPLLVLLTACGSAPTTPEDTTSSAPQATASNAESTKVAVVEEETVEEIPEADPQPQVRVQRASLRTTTSYKAPLKTDITSIVFSRTSNRRTPAAQWLHKELRLDSNLTVTLTAYSKSGKVIERKRGRVSEKEYVTLVSALKRARYDTLDPIRRPKFLAGNVTDLVTVSTAKEFRQFKEDEKQQFPQAIQAIFTRYTKGR